MFNKNINRTAVLIFLARDETLCSYNVSNKFLGLHLGLHFQNGNFMQGKNGNEPKKAAFQLPFFDPRIGQCRRELLHGLGLTFRSRNFPKGVCPKPITLTSLMNHSLSNILSVSAGDICPMPREDLIRIVRVKADFGVLTRKIRSARLPLSRDRKKQFGRGGSVWGNLPPVWPLCLQNHES